MFFRIPKLETISWKVEEMIEPVGRPKKEPK